MNTLKRNETGLTLQNHCCERGISAAAFYKWLYKCGVIDTTVMARMKGHDKDHRTLKLKFAEEPTKSKILA